MKYLFSMLLFCAALTLSAESKFLKVSEFQYDFDKKSITFQVENTSGKDISSFDCKLELEIDRRDFEVYANGSKLKKGEADADPGPAEPEPEKPGEKNLRKPGDLARRPLDHHHEIRGRDGSQKIGRHQSQPRQPETPRRQAESRRPEQPRPLNAIQRPPLFRQNDGATPVRLRKKRLKE
ncbi:MAG: hypothetical protein V8T86_03775 [Victivallis sp.]